MNLKTFIYIRSPLLVKPRLIFLRVTKMFYFTQLPFLYKENLFLCKKKEEEFFFYFCTTQQNNLISRQPFNVFKKVNDMFPTYQYLMLKKLITIKTYLVFCKKIFFNCILIEITVQKWSWTTDKWIFNPLLYLLSYLDYCIK